MGNDDIGLRLEGSVLSPGFGNGVTSAYFQISGNTLVDMIILIMVVNGLIICGVISL